MAAIAVKLLSKVVHNGLFVEAGKTLQLEVEHAESLIEDGVAEIEGKRTARKAKTDDDGDGTGE